MKNQLIYKKSIKFVIIIGIIAYIIMFIDTFFMQDIETMVLENGTLEETKTTDGIITRTEAVVVLDSKNDLVPLVSAGDRVSKGQILATIKGESSAELEEKIKNLNENMGDIAIPHSFSGEIKTLDSKLNLLLNQIVKKGDYKSFSEIIKYKQNLNEYIRNKVYKISENDSENIEIKEYVTKMSEYENQLKKLQTNVKSTMAGTVIYKLDGFEEILTTEKISNYTPELLENFNIPKGELIGTSKSNSFKIVDNLECYITVILDKEEADGVFVDQKAKIRFPEIDTHLEATGTIDYINFANDGVVVTFKINRAIENIMNYRKTKVEIVWDSESGYKVPSDAIVNQNGINKIYVYLNRNYIVEKKVEVKKEYNGWAIIDGFDGDKLYLYDTVVLNAVNINKNKLLKD